MTATPAHLQPREHVVTSKDGTYQATGILSYADFRRYVWGHFTWGKRDEALPLVHTADMAAWAQSEVAAYSARIDAERAARNAVVAKASLFLNTGIAA